MHQLGILFNQQQLHGQDTAQAAFEIFLRLIDVRLLNGCTISHGPIEPWRYCIALSCDDPAALKEISNTVAVSRHKASFSAVAGTISEDSSCCAGKKAEQKPASGSRHHIRHTSFCHSVRDGPQEQLDLPNV